MTVAENFSSYPGSVPRIAERSTPSSWLIFCQCSLDPLGSGGWVQISVSRVTFEPSPGVLGTLRISSSGYER